MLLALLLAALPADFQTVRDKGNESGLIVYDVWSVATVGAGLAGIATTQDPKWQGVHIAHLVWGGVNVVIGLISSIITFKSTPEKEDDEKARRGGRQQQILYAVNACFDVATTMVSAAMLQGLKDDRWQGFAAASLVQSAFLLVFDTTMSMFHWLNNRRAGVDSAFKTD